MRRAMILKELVEIYERDPHEKIHTINLAQKVKVGTEKLLQLLAIFAYLEDKGYVSCHFPQGPHCHVQLTAAGYQELQEKVSYDDVAMSNAYKLLFTLENQLRSFVESNLRLKYGEHWWERGISEGIGEKVDQMYKDEKAVGWQIARTDSKPEYLMFEHIAKIIINNWTDVFEPIFNDSAKIQLRLQELEFIRNAIAHTRTLSVDAYNRLEQYSRDILNKASNIEFIASLSSSYPYHLTASKKGRNRP
jgi:predicted nucleic acid-binding OB-fold protein